MSDNMTDTDVQAAMAKYRTPAVALVKMYPRERPGTPGCWLGGQPTLPAHIPWPMYQFAQDDYPAVPMHFLCQLDLAQFPRLEGFEEMPERGTLFFFFDPVHTPGGPETWEASTVLYAEGDVSAVPRRAPPQMPDGIEPLSQNYKGTSEYGYWPVELHVVETYPWGSWGQETPKGKPEIVEAPYREAIGKHYEQLREDQLDQLMPIPNDPTWVGKRLHSLHASLGANPLEHDAQHGGFKHAAVRLLRLEPDRDMGFAAGDAEPVEFWIPRAALRERDCSQAAMYLSLSPMGA